NRPGRCASRWYSYPAASMHVLLPCAEDLVTRIAQAGNDVAMLVQMLVHRGSEDLHVGVGFIDPLDPLRRGHQHQRSDLVGAGPLEHVDGSDHGAARGQHGADDQRPALVQFVDQLLQVGVGLEGFLVAHQADHAHLGTGDQAEYAVEHAQTGAQDGYHGDLLAGQLLDFDITTPAIDDMAFNRHV